MDLPKGCCWEDRNCGGDGMTCKRNEDPEVSGVCVGKGGECSDEPAKACPNAMRRCQSNENPEDMKKCVMDAVKQNSDGKCCMDLMKKMMGGGEGKGSGSGGMMCSDEPAEACPTAMRMCRGKGSEEEQKKCFVANAFE